MPLTRIVCRDTLSEEVLAIISDTLHDCLVREFAVPAQDKFQIFERLPASQRVYDRHYLSGGRSDDFILVLITAGKPRSTEQKRQFYQALSAGLSEKVGISPEDVMVTIQFNQAEDWSFSRGEQYI
ncbi:tautomerase family protein [Scandinavium goeteborgense]|uniref:Tautomerase-like protein n=1 Tax=Scandinavium goeteborgense TaxID=1851514 RepID=A0A4R6EE84_SCAGO|nr:tautomerase family protein [Scandinavium goeteborgense]TDN56534.1 tautomerase-like protein [Scandinavium goeteborgense]